MFIARSILRSALHSLCWAVLALPSASAALTAQTPRRTSLGPATAKLAEEFSGLFSARELSDGRVILTDNRENRIVIADFRANRVVPIGRSGNGPGEYVRAVQLHPLGGDSSLIVFSTAMRWTVIDPRDSLSTLPSTMPVVTFMKQGIVKGTDASGHLLTSRMPPRQPGQLQDTSFLLLVTRATMKVDTLARVHGGRSPVPQSMAEIDARGELLPAYPVADMSALALDGWVVVVRNNPYRVEWRAPDGRWTKGATIPDPVIKLDDREKNAFLEARRPRANTTPITMGPGTMAPGTGYGPPPPPPRWGYWPEVVPAFTIRSSILVTRHGEVLVQRTPTAALSTPLFDVIDRQGVRQYQLQLPANQRILGFGNGSVYVVTKDNDDIETVSRHAWP